MDAEQQVDGADAEPEDGEKPGRAPRARRTPAAPRKYGEVRGEFRLADAGDWVPRDAQQSLRQR